MTRGDLKRHIALEFGLDLFTSGSEDLLMNDWANDAVVDLLLATRCRVEVGDQALTIGVDDYRLDANVMMVHERTVEANTTKLRIITTEQMFDLRRATGAQAELTYIAAQGDLLMVYPSPTAAVTIRYIYIGKPTVMSSDSHDPSSTTYGAVPTQYHTGLLAYMRWRASLFNQLKAPHRPVDYRQFYEEECKRIRKRASRMASRSPVGMTAGYPASSVVGRRNDAYPAE